MCCISLSFSCSWLHLCNSKDFVDLMPCYANSKSVNIAFLVFLVRSITHQFSIPMHYHLWSFIWVKLFSHNRVDFRSVSRRLSRHCRTWQWSIINILSICFRDCCSENGNICVRQCGLMLTPHLEISLCSEECMFFTLTWTARHSSSIVFDSELVFQFDMHNLLRVFLPLGHCCHAHQLHILMHLLPFSCDSHAVGALPVASFTDRLSLFAAPILHLRLPFSFFEVAADRSKTPYPPLFWWHSLHVCEQYQNSSFNSALNYCSLLVCASETLYLFFFIRLNWFMIALNFAI